MYMGLDQPKCPILKFLHAYRPCVEADTIYSVEIATFRQSYGNDVMGNPAGSQRNA